MGKRRGRGRRSSGKRRGGDSDADEGGGGKRRREGESEEDYCFACKDGGLLRFCDHRNCHKAYHPECVDKDDSFLNSDEQFICKFVPVMRQTMGFCNNCLRMAIMIEKNVDVDSDGERVDFSDRETYEFLFKDYWDIIRDKEGLTLDNMREAYTLLRSGLNCNELSDMEKLPNSEQSSDEDFLGNSDDDDEPVYPSVSNGTSNKAKTILKEGKTKKQVYVGWGSIELIGFMSSIGKDTSKPLDQFGAAEVVKQYIRQNDLLQKDKKKQVICDGKLWSLFRKSKLKYNKIYSLLEKHIAENITPEDESLDSSEDNTDSIMERKSRIMNTELGTPEEVSERYRRCFASLVRENIKLIYLRRTLVIDLLKQPDTFECKVIGCFVRVKNDPREYSRHKPQKLYQLGQVTVFSDKSFIYYLLTKAYVTGIRKSSEEYKIRDISTDILLCISDMWSDVKISVLSDEDFEEEECEDLRSLSRKEPSKRQTVHAYFRDGTKKCLVLGCVGHGWAKSKNSLYKMADDVASRKGEQFAYGMSSELDVFIQAEFEEKARSMHADIMSHWINKELQRLEKWIEMANEKGTNSNKDRVDCLKNCSGEKLKGNKRDRPLCLESLSEEKPEGSKGDADAPGMCLEKVITKAIEVNPPGDMPRSHVQNHGTKATAAVNPGQVIDIDDGEDDLHGKSGDMIVDLDSDGSEDHGTRQHEAKPKLCSGPKAVEAKEEISEHASVWYYNDPQGDEQGPFPLQILRHWLKAGYFKEDFRVWRTGQSCDSAILLKDALLLTS
uniref:GYF domain-containing protein n=1 Tax=Oryza meridionalis TaxID=40149 RepID=A0A0E0DRJ3_9ORYZ